MFCRPTGPSSTTKAPVSKDSMGKTETKQESSSAASAALQ